MATLNDVYAKFGEVSEAAQLLETELANMILAAEALGTDLRLAPDPLAGRRILDAVNRQTLGGLLRKVFEQEKALEQGADLLAQALAERNRLAHSFYREHNFRRNTFEGRVVMLHDLETIHTTLLDAYKLVLRVSGIDLDTVELDCLPTRHLPLE